MSITRRALLTGAAQLAAVGAVANNDRPSDAAALQSSDGTLPARRDFAIPSGQTYLNSAFIHPIPLVAADAMSRYLETRTFSRERWSGDDLAAKVRAQFATLVNAAPAEISLVESTSRGENLVVNGLGVPSNNGNVVTDALHFEGSLVLYGELQKRGLDVRLVRPRDWRIELADMEKVVDRKTRLVALSLVSWYNGFQHDLERVCELAHAHGAYVYADIVQAAGNTPIDVRASGVDFCACSTFKWLMGDFGLGFLYIREGLLDAVIRRSEYGYQQADTSLHYLPSDPPASAPVTWTMHEDARAHFQVGTYGQGATNALGESLAYLQHLGVDKIHAHRQPLLRRLHEEMPRLGFTSITPPDTRSAIVAFTARDAEKRFAGRLKQANVSVTLSGERLRISPSLFNDARDIDLLLSALS
jgi:selenocysteine lyase/cysteine desulfurase